MLPIALMACLPAWAARITEKCTNNWEAENLILSGSDAGMAALADLAANPSRDPEAYDRLWRPKAAWVSPYSFDRWMTLTYDWIEDTAQIARDITADGILARYGVAITSVDSYAGCFATSPPPSAVFVTEYYNRLTDHYFMSSSTAENSFIDSGSAREGWMRTGESFVATVANSCYGAVPVFRFYGASNNSHFFTASPVECGLLRNLDPGWQYEAAKFGAFGAYPAVNGACPDGRHPVYRLYNNRAAQHDSNHRHVTRLDLYIQMQARGWIGEGVAFCVPN